MERLNPSDYVLSIMRHGLQFDLKETPPPYFEPNNQSCIQNLSVAQSQVEKWLEFARPFHFYPDIVTGSEHSTCNFLTARVWRILKLLWRDSELRTSARKVSRLPVSRPCWIRRPLFRMYKCTEVGAQNKLHSTTTTVASTEEWILVLSYCSNFILFFSHSRKYN